MFTFLKKNSRLLYICLLFLLVLPAVIPLLHSGLPPTHDGEYHVVRFYEFYKALSQGDIYPRWAYDLNKGYGVPLFNYVYPLPNYFAALLHVISLSFIDSFKISLLIATFIGSLFIFLFTREYWGDLGALISGVSFAYAPYRFVDTYVRGSIGEVWALALFPALLWSLLRLSRKTSIENSIITGILFAGLIFSHNILAVMFTFVIISYSLFLLYSNKNKKRLFIYFGISGVIGISLSAVFWLPALTETKYVKGLEIYSIQENFPDLYQLLIPSWGTGFSGGDLDNQMSFQIGLVPLLSVILSLLVLIKVQREKKKRNIILFFFFWFIIATFFMLQQSNVLWLKIPLFNYFQFPWRFLSVVIVCTSILSGSIVSFFTINKVKIFVCIAFIGLAIITTISYTKPAYYLERNDNYYTTRPNFIEGTNSPGDLFNTIWMGKTIKMNQGVTFLYGSGKITPEVENSSYRKYTIISDGASLMQASVAYFPGWTVFQDGKKLIPTHARDGSLTFNTSKGKHTVEIIFLDTAMRQVANIWTILTILVIISYFIKKQMRIVTI